MDIYQEKQNTDIEKTAGGKTQDNGRLFSDLFEDRKAWNAGKAGNMDERGHWSRATCQNANSPNLPGLNLSDTTERTPAIEKQAQAQKTDQIDGSEFCTISAQILARLDKKHTGEITRGQLGRAIEDPSFKGKEAQALAAMYQNFDSLHNLSNHEGWTGSHTLSLSDMDKYSRMFKTSSVLIGNAESMRSWALQNFNYFDRDNNGSLSQSEIARALKDPLTGTHDKNVLKDIQAHYKNMGHMWESGINVRALKEYADGVRRDATGSELISNIWSSCYSVNQGQKEGINHDLFADKKEPLHSITPDAIKQGSIGNCYFESSLASVAGAHPQMIKDAIKDNGDGTYTVRFAGHKNNPLRVKAPTEAEQGLYNHGSSYGLWASVMEKAYGSYCQQHFWRRNVSNLGGGYAPAEGAEGGGKTGDVVTLITGQETSTKSIANTAPETIRQDLEKAFGHDARKVVTASILTDLDSGKTTKDNFYKCHAYSITNFAPDGKGGGMVTVRNPWGGKEGTTAGSISIPLNKLFNNFTEVNFEL